MLLLLEANKVENNVIFVLYFLVLLNLVDVKANSIASVYIEMFITLFPRQFVLAIIRFRHIIVIAIKVLFSKLH